MKRNYTKPLPDGVTVLKGPEVSAPMNNIAGLYIQIKRPHSVPLADCIPALKSMASEHGYRPEGRGEIGPPCSYGIDSVTHAVWFYERNKP